MMTSYKQIEANRSNAQRSTGPRTEEGKAASSQNAVRHGIYGTKPTAVPRGHFAEEQSEVDHLVVGVLKALKPRDSIEGAQALRIAQQYLRLRRLNRFEAEALAAIAPIDMYVSFSNPERASREASAFMALSESLNMVTTLDGRIGRALESSLIVYGQMQRRSLPEQDS